MPMLTDYTGGVCCLQNSEQNELMGLRSRAHRSGVNSGVDFARQKVIRLAARPSDSNRGIRGPGQQSNSKGISPLLVRQYTLQILGCTTDAFVAAIVDLVAALNGIEGFAGAELLRDNEDPHAYLFTERWMSLDAYADGTQQLPGTILKSLLKTLDVPPKAASLTPVAF